MDIIPFSHLLVMLMPVGIVGYFYYRWIGDAREVVTATFRMVAQLLLIGYLLVYIFNNQNCIAGLLIVLFMVLVSSLIALRNVQRKSVQTYVKIFVSILIGGSINLLLVLYAVIDLEPLYQPRFVIPLAGMIYANAMNAISLAAERFENEIKTHTYEAARATAFHGALIPQINSFLAVGLVSLPGMMTGQILSGVDPTVAVRYQIVVMAMVLGSAGISVVSYLLLKSAQSKDTVKAETLLEEYDDE